MNSPSSPLLMLCILIVMHFVITLSRTTFYYGGEDGVTHILNLWFRIPVIFYFIFLVAYFVLHIMVNGDRIRRLRENLSGLFYSAIASICFVFVLTVAGLQMISLHYESAYHSNPGGNLHLEPQYYLHIPVYIMLVVFYDWLVKRFLFSRQENTSG